MPSTEIATELSNAPLTKRRIYLELFLVSYLALFFELACIRWFGGAVVYLSFFTNIVLLASFLGISVGCFAASGRSDWRPKVIPLFLVAVVLACVVSFIFLRVIPYRLDIGGQGSPQQVYFGTEYPGKDLARFVVPIDIVACLFFVLIASVFVGVGQAMGNLFDEAPNRLVAYVSNIGGSLVGIVAFSLASYLRTRPILWFSIVLVLWWGCYTNRARRQTAFAVYILIIMAVVSYQGNLLALVEANAPVWTWSPYNEIKYDPLPQVIYTNSIGHQTMLPVQDKGPAYELLHLLNRDSGGAPFEDVLVIGAGSGNDVEAALENGAKHVDAVEIDPAIVGLGKANHPNRPYDDLRVTVHIDDGRNYLRKTSHKYDLIVYALLDSLVLQSGYSSIRLESFLFTQQAFNDVASKLKPNGIFAAYNFYRQGWIVGRIDQMASQAFGSQPLVISLPYAPDIRAGDRQRGFTLIFASHNAPALGAISKQFTEQQSFWINSKPARNIPIKGFAPQPPPGDDWLHIAPARVDTAGINRVPSDDWPFLYLHRASIPFLNVRSIFFFGALSLLMIYKASPVHPVRANWGMFFLGAGFMLLETKGVVHIALLFGSTWLVNSIVIFAILVMVLASNVYVLAFKPKRLLPHYILLCAALVAGLLVPMSTFLALPGLTRVALSSAVIFTPIFFAGVIFATLFRDSQEPSRDFGSNIAGAIAGGLAENLSLILGFNNLLLVALGFYLLSAGFEWAGRGRKLRQIAAAQIN